jgi:septum formation protein
VPFRVEVSGAEELTEGEPRDVVVENALRKARAVEGDVVLGADTEVVLDGHIYGKARDRDEAERFLRRLSGRAHEVWGGLALRRNGQEQTAAAVTRVRFRLLDQADLDWYLDSGEWQERAGAYAIQGLGSALVESVEGDFWNVVGLPVAELMRLAPDLIRG